MEPVSNGMRIQKYMSQEGMCSRREAEYFISRGLVKLNGKVVTEMGIQIDPAKDKVELLRQKALSNKQTLAFHKPRGMTTEEITSFKPEFKILSPVGRLDKESEGLILLTNDGLVTKSVTSDKHLVEKEYEVTVQEDVNPGKMRKMEAGIRLEDGMTMPAKAERLSVHSFSLIIKEGRKHQIRRMADALHLTVVKLKRVRVGNISVKGIPEAGYRILNAKEVEILRNSSR